MVREDWEELEHQLMKVVVKRRALGGYSTEAADFLLLAEFMLKMVRHFHERAPRTKTKKDE